MPRAGVDRPVFQRARRRAKIGDIGMPKIIVGAELDRLCPAWMAQKLGEAAREPKSVRIVNGRVHAEFLAQSEWQWIAARLSDTGSKNATAR